MGFSAMPRIEEVKAAGLGPVVDHITSYLANQKLSEWQVSIVICCLMYMDLSEHSVDDAQFERNVKGRAAFLRRNWRKQQKGWLR